MIESKVIVSMDGDNALGCSYAIVTKCSSNSTVLIMFKGKDCTIVDFDALQSNNMRCLLMKHHMNSHDTYSDFMKLIGKMCKKNETSKYFRKDYDEDNIVICTGSDERHVKECDAGAFKDRRAKLLEFIMEHKSDFL